MGLRSYLKQGLKVGLGTDVAGGYSPSMLDAMRQVSGQCISQFILGISIFRKLLLGVIIFTHFIVVGHKLVENQRN